MAKKFRILFHGILLILGAFSGSFCMVVMVQGFSANNAQEIKTGISFPYRVPGTDLVVLALVATEGDVSVDNPELPKFNLASILLRNEGDWASRCEIVLKSGEQVWLFEGTMLPPGSETLILESKRQHYPDTPILSCVGVADCFTPKPIDVELREEDMQSFTVCNTGESEIRELIIYYKTYYKEWNLYGEGIAHECVTTNLQPGEKRLLYPERYAGEYSRILFAAVS